MKKNVPLSWIVLAFASAIVLSSLTPSAEADDSDVLPAVLDLLKDPDRELRSLALQRVRDGLEGTEVTKTLVELLPSLPTDAQADLLVALGVRSDPAARPAMRDAFDSDAAGVRAAAFRAAATLADATDVPRLVRGLAAPTEAERRAAKSTLERLRGDKIDEAIVAQFREARHEMQVELIRLLTAREATVAVPVLLEAAENSEDAVRDAALAALCPLVEPEHVPVLVRLLLAAEEGASRETWERIVMFACQRIESPDQQAAPLLEAINEAKDRDKPALISTVGRIGGSAALKVVEAAIANQDPAHREAGVRALCNWPNASVAPQLLRLAQRADERGQRLRAVRSLMRVAVLPDDRSDAERLDLLKQAWTLATRDEEYRLALERARAVRTIESLRFVVPYLTQPTFAETACATVVELAHHRTLRAPNQAEFTKALNTVIAVSKNAELIKRAERYKKGQTL